MRVKIIDEYNRIPTRTQSALLTRDGRQLRRDARPDLRVPRGRLVPDRQRRRGRRHLPGDRGAARPHRRRRQGAGVQHRASSASCSTRIEEGIRPEEVVPAQIVFTEAEMDRLHDEICAVDAARRRCGGGSSSSPASSSSSSRRRAVRVQDQGHGAARRRRPGSLLGADDTGRDRLKDLGSQTRNGLSVRALHDAARASSRRWPTSAATARSELEDVRQILPFVLHDKLVPDPDAPFFEAAGQRRATAPTGSAGSAGCSTCPAPSTTGWTWTATTRSPSPGRVRARARRRRRERGPRRGWCTSSALLATWIDGRKLYGHLYDDLLEAQVPAPALHQLPRWLTTQAGT